MQENLGSILTPTFLSLLVALGIGLVIGMEREINAQPDMKHFAGIRTMPLVSMLGWMTALAAETYSWILVAAVLGFMGFAATAYFVKARQGTLPIKHEIAMLVVFFMGILAGMNLLQESLTVMVLTVTVLSFKERFHYILDKLTAQEFLAFVKFIMIAVLIFPFVPEGGFGPEGIFKPREIALVVLIVMSLNFVSYLLMKFGDPKKSILWTAFVGGLYSSTAVTWVYSSRSKQEPELAMLYGAGILLAWSLMFFRILFFCFLFNAQIIQFLLLPTLSGGLLTAGVAGFYIRRQKLKKKPEDLVLGSPIDLSNALLFAGIYAAIVAVIYYADKWFGEAGLFATGALAGVTDIDAITINMAKYADTGEKLPMAAAVIVVAALTNNLVKLGITFFKGGRQVAKMVGLVFAIVLAVQLIWLVARMI